MLLDDPPALGAQGLGGGDILLLLELEDLAPDDPGHGHPIEGAKGDEHGDHVGSHRVEQGPDDAGGGSQTLGKPLLQHHGDQQDHQHLGHRLNDLHDPLHDRVHHPSGIAGDGAVDSADDQHQQGGEHAYQQGDPGADHGTDHNVPAKAVSAENVGEDLLPGGLPLQLLPGVAKQLGLQAVLRNDALLGDLAVAAGLLGLVLDGDLLHDGELPALGLRLGPGRSHSLLGGHAALGGLGELLLNEKLVLQRIVEGVEIFRAPVELVIAVRHHHGSHEGKEHDKHQHGQGHHSHRVAAEPPPSVLPIGGGGTVGDEAFLLRLVGGDKGAGGQGPEIKGFLVQVKGPGLAKGNFLLVSHASALLCQIDPRIHHFIKEVHDQVHDDNEGRQENGGAHNDGIVPVGDALDKVLAQAGDGEYLLHHKAAAENKGDLGA